MGTKAGISRKDFLEGWKATEEAVPLTLPLEPEEILDYFDLQEDPALIFTSIVQGAVFVDVSRGSERFR